MNDGALRQLPAQVRVVIEVPRGAFVKRAANGNIDFISPVPSPYNYGSAVDLPGWDGEPADALVLGEPLPRRHEGVYPVHGVVWFLDEGLQDDKLICGIHPPTSRDLAGLDQFFRRYAWAKRLVSLTRRRGPVRYRGIALRQE